MGVTVPNKACGCSTYRLALTHCWVFALAALASAFALDDPLIDATSQPLVSTGPAFRHHGSQRPTVRNRLRTCDRYVLITTVPWQQEQNAPPRHLVAYDNAPCDLISNADFSRGIRVIEDQLYARPQLFCLSKWQVFVSRQMTNLTEGSCNGHMMTPYGPRLPVCHVCFHGEFQRITGRGTHVEKTARMTQSRVRQESWQSIGGESPPRGRSSQPPRPRVMHEVLLARAAVKRSQGRPRAEY